MQGCSVQPFDGGSEVATSHVTDGTQVNELQMNELTLIIRMKRVEHWGY